MTRLTMQVSRCGDRYRGSLTRVGDQRSLPFSGLLELIAVLERLTAESEPGSASGDSNDPEVPDA